MDPRTVVPEMPAARCITCGSPVQVQQLPVQDQEGCRDQLPPGRQASRSRRTVQHALTRPLLPRSDSHSANHRTLLGSAPSASPPNTWRPQRRLPARWVRGRTSPSSLHHPSLYISLLSPPPSLCSITPVSRLRGHVTLLRLQDECFLDKQTSVPVRCLC